MAWPKILKLKIILKHKNLRKNNLCDTIQRTYNTERVIHNKKHDYQTIL